MVLIESAHVEKQQIIGTPSLPTSLDRIWSQPPTAPWRGMRVLSAALNETSFLAINSSLMRSAIDGPPSSLKADGSRWPYVSFGSSAYRSANPRPTTSAVSLSPEPYHSR